MKLKLLLGSSLFLSLFACQQSMTSIEPGLSVQSKQEALSDTSINPLTRNQSSANTKTDSQPSSAANGCRSHIEFMKEHVGNELPSVIPSNYPSKSFSDMLYIKTYFENCPELKEIKTNKFYHFIQTKPIPFYLYDRNALRYQFTPSTKRIKFATERREELEHELRKLLESISTEFSYCAVHHWTRQSPVTMYAETEFTNGVKVTSEPFIFELSDENLEICKLTPFANHPMAVYSSGAPPGATEPPETYAEALAWGPIWLKRWEEKRDRFLKEQREQKAD